MEHGGRLCENLTMAAMGARAAFELKLTKEMKAASTKRSLRTRGPSNPSTKRPERVVVIGSFYAKLSQSRRGDGHNGAKQIAEEWTELKDDSESICGLAQETASTYIRFSPRRWMGFTT